MLDWKNREVIEKFLQVIEHDGIVLAQSDTVLGLFGRLSQISKEKLDTIKKRNLKPYIVLIQSANLLPRFIDQQLTSDMQKIIDTYWPGPLTIIFKAKSSLPDWLQGSNGTIAMRVPDHQGLQQLLQQIDGLFTTSANISDQPLPNCYEVIDPIILEQVQLVCCTPGVLYDGLASTILDFSSGSIKIIRQGAIQLNSI